VAGSKVLQITVITESLELTENLRSSFFSKHLLAQGFCEDISGNKPLPGVSAEARSSMSVGAQFQPVHLENTGV
jgi:hypothetical protein